MIDVQRAHDAILRATVAYEKAKEKAEFEWSKPVAEDMLALLMAGIRKDALGMLGIGGNYGNKK